MCTSVKNISAVTCGKNPGGQRRFYVLGVQDFISRPDPVADTHVIEDDLVLVALKKFAEWGFALGTAELTYSTPGESGRQSVSAGIEFEMNGANAADEKVVNDAINGQFICLVEDGKGKLRLVGEKNNPLKLEVDYKSGKKGTDANIKTVKFTGEGYDNVPFYYEGEVLVLS